MKVFLCHASEDIAIAERIQLALTNAGCIVFFDEQSLPPGGDFHGRIRRAIDECDIFIFLISSNSVAQGKFTLTELQFAREKWPGPVGNILPVNIGDLPTQSIPSYLTTVTVLPIRVNAPSEVRAAVEKMIATRRSRKRQLLKITVALGLIVFAISLTLLIRAPNSIWPDNNLTREKMNSLFGADNWFCYPDRQDGLGVRKLPYHFRVEKPIRHVQTSENTYYVSQIAVGGGGANVELSSPFWLPKDECPLSQQDALVQWVIASKKGMLLDQTLFNEMFGEGNWQCHPDRKVHFAVVATALVSSLTIRYPITNVNSNDGLKYGVGQQVPPGSATVWLAGQIPRNECPNNDRNGPPCKFENIFKSSAVIPVFVRDESSSTISSLSGNWVSVIFENDANGSGVAFRLTPMLEINDCRLLELSGTSSKRFTFLVEYKIERAGELFIAQQSKPQIFPRTTGTYTAAIPLEFGDRFRSPVREIVLNFLKVGESSQLTIESLQLK